MSGMSTHPRITRDDLATELASLNLPPGDYRSIIDALVDRMAQHLEAGDTVVLWGFGVLDATPLPSRRVRCPRIPSGPDAFRQVPATIRYRWRPGRRFTR